MSHDELVSLSARTVLPERHVLVYICVRGTNKPPCCISYSRSIVHFLVHPVHRICGLVSRSIILVPLELAIWFVKSFLLLGRNAVSNEVRIGQNAIRIDYAY